MSSSSKFCTLCGSKLRKDSKFCSKCGKKVRITFYGHVNRNLSFKNVNNKQKYSSEILQKQNDLQTVKVSEKQDKIVDKDNYDHGNTLNGLLAIEKDINDLKLNVYYKDIYNSCISQINREINSQYQTQKIIENILARDSNKFSQIKNIKWESLKESLQLIEDDWSISEEYNLILAMNLHFMYSQTLSKEKEFLHELKGILSAIEDDKYDKLVAKRENIFSSLFSEIQNNFSLKEFEIFFQNLQSNLISYELDHEIITKTVEYLQQAESSLALTSRNLYHSGSISIPYVFGGSQISDMDKGGQYYRSRASFISTVIFLRQAQSYLSSVSHYQEEIIIPCINDDIFVESIFKDWVINNKIVQSRELVVSGLTIIRSTLRNLNNILSKLNTEKNRLKYNLKQNYETLKSSRKQLLQGKVLKIKKINYIPSTSGIIRSTLELRKPQIQIIEKTIGNDNFPVRPLTRLINYFDDKSKPIKEVDELKSVSNIDRTTNQSEHQKIDPEKPVSPRELTNSPEDSPSIDYQTDEIQKTLQDLKYSFKKLDFKDKVANAIFYSGSIYSVRWDFSGRFLKVNAQLTKKRDLTLEIFFKQDKDHGTYDWRNPYKFVNVKSPNPQIESKIRRETRIPEKMNKIQGALSMDIKGSTIKLELAKIKENIKPTLDLIKELGWLLEITLN